MTLLHVRHALSSSSTSRFAKRLRHTADISVQGKGTCANVEVTVRLYGRHNLTKDAEVRDRMIWLYQRDDEALRLETTFDNATSEFVLIQQRPGDAQITERFSSEDDFRARLTALSAALDEERWQRNGPPLLLNDGWKL